MVTDRMLEPELCAAAWRNHYPNDEKHLFVLVSARIYGLIFFFPSQVRPEIV